MKRLNFSLSAKITVVFTVIIFTCVIGFSALMIAMTQQSLESQRSDELWKALGILESAVLSSPDEDIRMRADALPYYVLYKIISPEGNTLRTNDALIPKIDTITGSKAAHYFVKNFFTDGNLNLVYMSKTVEKKSAENEINVYKVQAAIDLENDDIDIMLNRLPFIFMLLAAPLFVISAIVGYVVCKHLLAPIKKIIRQAQNISGEKLDARLDESGANDELQELAHTFNELFFRLEKDFEKQKRFTSDAAHELKTPLAVITGYVDILSRWGKDDAKVLADSLAVLKRESTSMATLVENLLELTRAENSMQVKYEKSPLAMRQFLEQIKDDFKVVSPEAQFEIVCDADSVFDTNEDALRELLRIFIRNSISYSEGAAKICLEFCQHSNINNGKASLTVRDCGIGISEENLPKIFDRFYRADESRNRATGGNGLGLSIAKAVAQKLDATLSVTSELGKGTAITIAL